jgi:Domain of unknown function (DUF4188)
VTAKRVPRGYEKALGRAPKAVTGGQHVARMTGEEAVVFIIGMRVNRWRKVRSWWPTFVAMPGMLAELKETDAGLLAARTYWSGRVFLVVQHWRSAAELGAYARNGQMLHAPAWAAFNQSAAGTGDVGIFHETYVVAPDAVESLYGNMPRFGLAAAHGWVPRADAVHHSRANEQLQTTEPSYTEA